MGTADVTPLGLRGQYDAAYGNFQTELYERVRREAFGEDIGQNSWLTADEHDKFTDWLDIFAGKTLLDVGCGAGGPALRIAAATGCFVVGVDVHASAITAACSIAAKRGLERAATFQVVDAARALPFPDESFDAITCIDAINHLPDRLRVIADWCRLLKSGGRLLFTDPTVVTGPLTNREIFVRSSASLYVFVPLGYDECVIEGCNLQLLRSENVTHNMADIAERRRTARASHVSALQEVEGATNYDLQQEFLATTACIAKEGRLSRFVYLSQKD